MKKLAILATHPVQYHAPLFQLLTTNTSLKIRVFYTAANETYFFDPGFQQTIAWDIPILEGYDSWFTPRHPLQSIRKIEDFKPDAIWVFGWQPAGHLRVMRHFKGSIPVWFRGDSTLLDEKPGIQRWARRLFLRWVYRYVDRAFYVGDANRDYFTAHGLQSDQLVFAPHAVENTRFQPANSIEKSLLREKFGLRKQEIVALFCGKLAPRKAPDCLLAAILKYNKTNSPPVHLIFAGSGAMEKQLKQQAQGSPHIHFTGFQNQSHIPQLYRLSSFVCLPSVRGETWGLAINEAMAAGLPVLVSDRCGCARNLVQHNGYIFRAGDQEDLISKIALLAKAPERLEQMGQKSMEIIQPWCYEQIEKQICAELWKLP